MIEKYKLLYGREQVQRQIGRVASEITARYDGGERPLLYRYYAVQCLYITTNDRNYAPSAKL